MEGLFLIRLLLIAVLFKVMLVFRKSIELNNVKQAFIIWVQEEGITESLLLIDAELSPVPRFTVDSPRLKIYVGSI